jgi:hypothetical protein
MVLVLEIKSVAQLLTYLRISGLRMGLLLNFNEEPLKQSFRQTLAGPSASLPGPA